MNIETKVKESDEYLDLNEPERSFDELVALFNCSALKNSEIESRWHETLLDKLNASASETNRAGSTFRKFYYNEFRWVYITNPTNNSWVILRTD